MSFLVPLTKWMAAYWRDLLGLSVLSAILFLALAVYYGRVLHEERDWSGTTTLRFKKLCVAGFLVSLVTAILTIEWTVRTIEPVRSAPLLALVHILAAIAMLGIFLSLLRFTGVTHKRVHAPLAYVATGTFVFVAVTGYFLSRNYG